MPQIEPAVWEGSQGLLLRTVPGQAGLEGVCERAFAAYVYAVVPMGRYAYVCTCQVSGGKRSCMYVREALG